MLWRRLGTLGIAILIFAPVVAGIYLARLYEWWQRRDRWRGGGPSLDAANAPDHFLDYEYVADLTLPLAQPITLTRGPGSHLVTLMDAAILIRDLEPFRQARPVWDRTAEMILIAAETRKREDVAEATRQMLVALGHENWWKGA